MNKVILMGRLTKDVEIHQTSNGKSCARLSLAVNRRFKDSEGKYPTDFINCIAWNQTGNFIAQYFRKGSMIAVVGSIQSRSWDGEDGKKRYATEIIVDEAYFTGEKREQQNSPSPQGADSNAAPSDEDGVFNGEDAFGSEYDIAEDDLPF